MSYYTVRGGNTMANRILIAEDEPKLLEVICDYFISKGGKPVWNLALRFPCYKIR